LWQMQSNRASRRRECSGMEIASRYRDPARPVYYAAVLKAKK
jgi:hypothetical protein